MVALKQEERMQTFRLIIVALRVLGESSSTDIHKYIKGLTKKSRTLATEGTDMSGLEITRKREKNAPVSKRTIQRGLKELCERGYIRRVGKLYTLSDSAKANRFFGSRFGARVMENVIPRPDYNLRTVKDNLNSLVTLFGTIVIFCCMEAARPKKDHDTDKERQLMSTISWLNSIISAPSFFHYFLFVFKNQVDDEMISKLTKLTFYGIKKGKHIWVDEKTGKAYEDFPYAGMFPMFIDQKRKPYPTGFYRDIPFRDEYLHMDRYHGVYADYDPPIDEISHKTYLNLVKALKKLVPDLSSKLEELRKDKNHAGYFLEDTK
jgi:hypothetical protein